MKKILGLALGLMMIALTPAVGTAARSFLRDIAPSLDLIGLFANIADQLPIEARSLCRLQLMALRTATGDRLKKDRTTRKDF